MIATRYLCVCIDTGLFLFGREIMRIRKTDNGTHGCKSVKICDPSFCRDCQYIGEGDFMCDRYTEIVIADWVPTENFLLCEEKIGGKR